MYRKDAWVEGGDMERHISKVRGLSRLSLFHLYIKAPAQSVFGSPSQSAGKVVEVQPYTRLK